MPRSTAYGWLEWFESLPEGVQAGILEFMDTQVPIMAACQVPAVVPKAAAAKEAGQSGSDPSGTDGVRVAVGWPFFS